MTSLVGQGFVRLYYSVSPPMAAWISTRPWARAAARAVLTPVVVAAGAMTGSPADIALVAVSVAAGVALVRRMRRARGKAREGAR
jgi:hypothetical protein